MKKLLCRIAHWILYKYEPIDIMGMKIQTKVGTYKVYEIIPKEELYARTGIQKQIFNTIYQLMAVKQNNPEHLEQAESLLMLPDYFNFLLTGKKANEYTEASTSQL